MFITVYYSNDYHSFCISSNSYIKDEIFIGAKKHSPVEVDISGSCLPLDDGTHNRADYPRYKQKCGDKFYNPNVDNINPVAYAGGASIYINPEEQKQFGNSLYGYQTHLSNGALHNKTTYGILYNDIWYDKQDITVKEYTQNNISIYTNNSPTIGDNIYNAPKEIEGETIQLLLIDNIISNELVSLLC